MIRVLVVQVIACACLASAFPLLSAAEVSRADAIGIWVFDEGQGDVAEDSSDNDNHGKLIGEPKWVDGKNGGGLKFDGVGTSVEAEHHESLDLGRDDFTAVAWFKTDGGGGFLMSKTSLLADWVGFEVKFDGEKIRTCLQTIPVTICDNRGDGLHDGKWHHAAVVFSRKKGERYIYVDGKQQGDPIDHAVVQGSINTQEAFAIGVSMGDHRGGSFFTGVIDEVAVFKKELTKDDIAFVMENMEEVLSVSPLGRLTTTWGKIKQASQ